MKWYRFHIDELISSANLRIVRQIERTDYQETSTYLCLQLCCKRLRTLTHEQIKRRQHDSRRHGRRTRCAQCRYDRVDDVVTMRPHLWSPPASIPYGTYRWEDRMGRQWGGQ